MQKMYYYTSTETMKKIMQSGTMWATNLAYMNDAREMRNGLIEIRGILQDEKKLREWTRKYPVYKERIEKFEKIDFAKMSQDDKIEELLNVSSKYTLSFCRKKDLLSQWIAYARESGVCMEMQFDLDKEVKFNFYQKDSDIEERNLHKMEKPEEVLYYTNASDMPSSERESAENKILQRIFADYSVTDEAIEKRWKELSTYVKHYDFYQEQEYRIAFETLGWDSYRIGYRMDKSVLKPYLDAECENGWPISMIMVGPGHNQQVVYDSIRFYLNHEQIRSSLLCGLEQWKNHLYEYVDAASQKCGSSKHGKKIRESIDKLDEDDIKGNSGRAYIQKMLIDYMNDSGLKYQEYFKKHYFTTSGIILEKSDIPYIY